MRKNFFKKALAVMGVTTLLLGMSTNVYAADDIALEIGKDGQPITEVGTADGSGYKYQGVFSTTEATAGYKYLSITYTGDAGALDELRLEFATGGVRWFRENDEGVLVDKDGNQAPAPSATAQTFIIDLEKSGVTVGGTTHIHDTLGKGVLKISEAKLMKELPAAPETTTAAQQTTAAAQQTTAAAGSQATTGAGAAGTGAPTTGDSSVATAMIVTLVAGAAVVAVASRKKANAAE